MLSIRRSEDRGHANHGWLDSYHTFSFADYYDAAHMGFRSLRVINEDRVQPGTGFGTHPHRDMEIISYVLEGALAHRDSTGQSGVIRPGDVQRMSAGSGITHSEVNASTKEPVHFLQIWLLPARQGQSPGYEQKYFKPSELENQLRLVASPTGEAGGITVHQDVALYAARLSENSAVEHAAKPGRGVFVHVARGQVLCNGQLLRTGDAAALEKEALVTLQGSGAASEVLLFDLA